MNWLRFIQAKCRLRASDRLYLIREGDDYRLAGLQFNELLDVARWRERQHA